MTEEDFSMIIKEEGDFLKFEYLEYECILVRDDDFKTWCGYVKIPHRHPYKKIKENYHISVHGGITFESYKNDWYGLKGHIIGFDTCHHGDFNAYMFRFKNGYIGSPDIYRNKEYVIEQCHNICDQLDEINSYKRKRILKNLIYNKKVKI